MDAMESIKHNKQLFHEVYSYNPYCKKVLSRFNNSINTITNKLKSLKKNKKMPISNISKKLNKPYRYIKLL